MLNRTETNEIINAIERKYDKSEKLSFLSTENTFAIYKKNRLVRVTFDEMIEILAENITLLNEKRTQFDLIAEYLLNKLFKKNKPFPDVKALPENYLELVKQAQDDLSLTQGH